MVKIAWALIVKGDDEEAKLLGRSLKTIVPFVDKVFITITQPNRAVEEVARKNGCEVSHFKWEQNFAAARAFNFSQVPSEFTYLGWSDADDVLVSAENLREVVESMDIRGVKGVYTQYLYGFDDDGNVTVQHPKLRIVRNDGSFEWHQGMGEMHEDLQPTYNCPTAHLSINEPSCYFEVHHKTTGERVAENAKRNLAIARQQAKTYSNDPRSIWNLANSLVSVGQDIEASELYDKFINLSGSDEERYLAFIRQAALYTQRGLFEMASKYGNEAIALFPWYPDAWIGLGVMYYKQEKWKHAKEYLVAGMSKDPSEYAVVTNPRDYDQNPMVLLANCYFNMSKPRDCRTVLAKVVEMFPKNKQAKQMLEAVDKVVKEQDQVDELLKKSESLSDLEFSAELAGLPERLLSHPQVCIVRNERFKRSTTPGNEVAYYCGYTEEPWDRSNEETGIGGSEEAVLNLSKRWQAAGKQVVVYNNVKGGKQKTDKYGVVWKPFWMFNPRDKYDTIILWRSPVLADRKLDAKRVLVDMHDVVDPREFTSTRLANIDRVLVKSEYHRGLFRNIPDSKIGIIGNGIDLEQFSGSEKRLPQSLIYTSSPDRGLEHLLDAWPKLIKEFPKMTLNIYYGWGVFDSVHKTDPVMMKWKKDLIKKMDQPGIRVHGRVGHKEIARRMMQTDIYAYPCHFEEIFAISAAKALAAGCAPVVTKYAALPEVVTLGEVVEFNVKGKNWEAWYDALREALKETAIEPYRDALRAEVARFDWKKISIEWLKII